MYVYNAIQIKNFTKNLNDNEAPTKLRFFFFFLVFKNKFVFKNVFNFTIYKYFKIIIYRIRQITFFLENAFKKTTEYFLKFLFLFESTILPVNNEK